MIAKFYPDLPAARRRLAVADLLVLLWGLACLGAGYVVYTAMLTLGVIGDRLVAAGHAGDRAMAQLQRALAGLPDLKTNLQQVFDALHGLPQALITAGHGVIAAGRTADDAVTAVQQSAGGLPVVGGKLRDALAALHGLPQALIGMGQEIVGAGHAGTSALAGAQRSVAALPAMDAHLRGALVSLHGITGALSATGSDEMQTVARLALVLGVVVAGVPLLAVLLFYLPWRARKTRGFRYLDRLLRQPGAGAVPATLHVLAARALYTLPYDRLLRYSSDPLGEWHAGRYDNLARAAMAAEGLDLRRYLRRVEGMAPRPRQGDRPPMGHDIGDDIGV